MKSIKLNALSYIGIRVLNIIFPILTGTYVARVLNRTDYGYFNSVDTILSFFLPFATYGVYNYGLRTISNVKDNKKDLNRPALHPNNGTRENALMQPVFCNLQETGHLISVEF